MKAGESLTGLVDDLLDDNVRDLAALEGRLAAAADGAPPRTLLITSGRAGEGKTTVSIGIAAGLARHAGARVLLIDGHPASPRLSRLFGLEGRPGLADALLDDAGNTNGAVHATVFQRLWVMPRGQAADDRAARERGRRLAARIAQLAAAYDYVLFDADSVFDSSEATLVAPALGYAVLVVAAERTRWGAPEQAAATLERAGARVVGAIMNQRRRWIPERLYESH